MSLTRRNFVTGILSGALAAPTVANALDISSAWAAGGEIRVGGVMDISGPFQARAKANILRFAIEETNAAGGLLGRHVKLIQYDTQSNNQMYAQYGQQLVLNDKVAAVFGTITSAAREVIRPILDRGKVPYFYTTGYEGGVCDRYTFCTGATVGQCLGTLLPFAMQKFGKRAYVLGPDYLFGQVSEKWVRKIVAGHGGKVVGAELFPLDAANFSSTISNIQSAAPDFIIDSFVTPPQMSFYGQWTAAGMKAKIPIASQTFGNNGQHLQMPKEVSDGIVACYEYFQEMPGAANKAFVDKFHKRFGNDDYIGDVIFGDYIAWQLWAEAVKKAGSIEREPVLKALDQGMTIQTPGPVVKLDPKIHHCIFDMNVVEIRDRTFHILDTAKNVDAPEMAGRCDLIENPRLNRQFQPQI